MTDIVKLAVVIGKMKGGGVEATALAYLQNLNTERVHATVFIDSDSALVPENEIRLHGADIVYIPPYQHPVAYYRALYSFLKKGNFDIIHSHISTMSVFPLFAAKRASVPVRIVHSHATAGKGEYKKNLLKHILRPFSKVFATELCACSEYAGKWLYGKASDFTVLPNAIDYNARQYAFDAEIRKQMRSEMGLENAFVIGHAGRFIPQKNHFFLLDIFLRIYKQRPDAKLLMVGTGELMRNVRDRAEKYGIIKSVIFAGQRNDTAKYYQAMDILLFPSLYEGKPLVPMEAQISGIPAVVSDCITEEIIINMKLVRFIPLSASAEEWADAVVEMFRNAPPRGTDYLKVIKFDRQSNELPPEMLTDWYCGLKDRVTENETYRRGGKSQDS
jgi:Glycosyltransferase